MEPEASSKKEDPLKTPNTQQEETASYDHDMIMNMSSNLITLMMTNRSSILTLNLALRRLWETFKLKS